MVLLCISPECSYSIKVQLDPLNVLVVTILDTFKSSSKMLISTWLASTVLNRGIHIKTKCYEDKKIA